MIGASGADCAQDILGVDVEEMAWPWFARRCGDGLGVLAAGRVAQALTILLERGSGIAVLASDYRLRDQSGVDLLEAACMSCHHVVRVPVSVCADQTMALLPVPARQWGLLGLMPCTRRQAREPATGASGGSGTGWLFCRRVMAAIGGDITLRNAEGGGAPVVLRFPETTPLENLS